MNILFNNLSNELTIILNTDDFNKILEFLNKYVFIHEVEFLNYMQIYRKKIFECSEIDQNLNNSYIWKILELSLNLNTSSYSEYFENYEKTKPKLQELINKICLAEKIKNVSFELTEKFLYIISRITDSICLYYDNLLPIQKSIEIIDVLF